MLFPAPDHPSLRRRKERVPGPSLANERRDLRLELDELIFRGFHRRPRRAARFRVLDRLANAARVDLIRRGDQGRRRRRFVSGAATRVATPPLDAALSLSHSRGTARSSSVIGRLDPGLGRVSSVGFTEKLSSVPWNKKPGPGPGAPMSSLPNKSLYPARSKDTFSSSTTNEDDAPSPSPSPLSAPAADVSTEMRGRARPAVLEDPSRGRLRRLRRRRRAPDALAVLLRAVQLELVVEVVERALVVVELRRRAADERSQLSS